MISPNNSSNWQCSLFHNTGIYDQISRYENFSPYTHPSKGAFKIYPTGKNTHHNSLMWSFACLLEMRTSLGTCNQCITSHLDRLVRYLVSYWSLTNANYLIFPVAAKILWPVPFDKPDRCHHCSVCAM